MLRGLIVSAVAVFGLVLVLDGSSEGGDKDKPKYSIKEVMAKAHKSGLFKKIQAGNAEKADREELAELYKALVQSKPAKGDIETWKKTTVAMHKVAVAAIQDPEAGKKLKVNCGACHKEFK